MIYRDNFDIQINQISMQIRSDTMKPKLFGIQI